MKHNPKVLVVGDLMIDDWVYGDTNRLSPEAPIPILDFKNSKQYLGGAGNVIMNLVALGAKPIVISGISQTVDGHWIQAMIENDLNCTNGYFFDIPLSFKKQRICSGQQQIVRLDTGQGRDITDVEIEDALNKIDDPDIILVADYGKGTVTETVLSDLSVYAQQKGIDLLIDPYMRDYYFGGGLSSTMIKFNRLEAENFTAIKIEDDKSLQETGRILLDTFDTASVLITLGSKGMAYFDRKKYKKTPFRAQNNPVHVYDVCGAGDVVMAVLGYIMTYKPWEKQTERLIEIAAMAGMKAVSKSGTSVIQYEDLFDIGSRD